MQSKNKASWAEHAIFLIKRRLYTILRHKVENDWVTYLPYVVSGLNQVPQKSLGGVRPIQVQNELDDILVRDAQMKKNIPISKQPHWTEQEKNQETFENSASEQFKVGVLVYADKKEQIFDKSYFAQVRILFIEKFS